MKPFFRVSFRKDHAFIRKKSMASHRIHCIIYRAAGQPWLGVWLCKSLYPVLPECTGSNCVRVFSHCCHGRGDLTSKWWHFLDVTPNYNVWATASGSLQWSFLSICRLPMVGCQRPSVWAVWTYIFCNEGFACAWFMVLSEELLSLSNLENCRGPEH